MTEMCVQAKEEAEAILKAVLLPYYQQVTIHLLTHPEQARRMQAREEAERAIQEAREAKEKADLAWQRAEQVGSQADAELQQELEMVEKAVRERLSLGKVEE